MTVAERDVDLKLYYCEPCLLHDRITVRLATSEPEFPCGHYGQGPDDCKRSRWVSASWSCVQCRREGRTTIVYAHEKPTERCKRDHRAQWVESDDWLFVRSRAGAQ